MSERGVISPEIIAAVEAESESFLFLRDELTGRKYEYGEQVEFLWEGQWTEGSFVRKVPGRHEFKIRYGQKSSDECNVKEREVRPPYDPLQQADVYIFSHDAGFNGESGRGARVAERRLRELVRDAAGSANTGQASKVVRVSEKGEKGKEKGKGKGEKGKGEKGKRHAGKGVPAPGGGPWANGAVADDEPPSAGWQQDWPPEVKAEVPEESSQQQTRAGGWDSYDQQRYDAYDTAGPSGAKRAHPEGEQSADSAGGARKWRTFPMRARAEAGRRPPPPPPAPAEVSGASSLREAGGLRSRSPRRGEERVNKGKIWREGNGAVVPSGAPAPVAHGGNGAVASQGGGPPRPPPPPPPPPAQHAAVQSQASTRAPQNPDGSRGADPDGVRQVRASPVAPPPPIGGPPHHAPSPSVSSHSAAGPGGRPIGQAARARGQPQVAAPPQCVEPPLRTPPQGPGKVQPVGGKPAEDVPRHVQPPPKAKTMVLAPVCPSGAQPQDARPAAAVVRPPSRGGNPTPPAPAATSVPALVAPAQPRFIPPVRVPPVAAAATATAPPVMAPAPPLATAPPPPAAAPPPPPVSAVGVGRPPRTVPPRAARPQAVPPPRGEAGDWH
eukprot:CAMPEP_0171249650 /NCGR_PEP_ID=MMETSP0790-20130122/49657_1 /TAXON_ID=2925 /ORGANISM="Alexandrium catenella, Strain OF101" /LENGTH=609 /DNA_ID=CAMNT_0011717171 /DNA_START=6 /DNA_END=1834 /DNA_ORIENTATION=-